MLSGSSDVARVAVRSLTTEQRDDLFRCALSLLPVGHQLRSRIDELLRKRQTVGLAVDNELADETAVEAWMEIEAVKDAAGLKSVRAIEEYRSTWAAKRDFLLAHGSVANHELDEVQKAFAEAHQHHPSFCVWVYIDGSPRIEGPGALQFLELANRASSSFAKARGDSAWKDWLVVLVAYLLENDLKGEYLEKLPAGGWSLKSTHKPHHDSVFEGENYRIRAALKASELCCSWLVRFLRGDRVRSTATEDKASHARPRRKGSDGNAKRTPQARAWGDIKIDFVSDERVQITVGTETETRNYEEMGFGNRKDGKPILAWETLRGLAAAGGVVKIASDGRKWAEVEKRIQEIRRVFRRLFGLADDPIPYSKRTSRNAHEFGYRCKFKIGRRPSYES